MAAVQQHREVPIADPLLGRGSGEEAGDGVSDEEMVRQVGEQTSTDLKYQDFFERESDGTVTDTEAAKVDADEAEG